MCETQGGSWRVAAADDLQAGGRGSAGEHMISMGTVESGLAVRLESERRV
jgi:hypothetical protein